MARIRLKVGPNEIEIESRDFYIDNETVSKVIGELAQKLEESSVKVLDDHSLDSSQNTAVLDSDLDYLKMLKNAEVHEPEFCSPILLTTEELPVKIEELESDGFFTKPKTVSETVEQLLQHGFIVSPLAVSKILAKRAFNKELLKKSQERKTFYYKELLN